MTRACGFSLGSFIRGRSPPNDTPSLRLEKRQSGREFADRISLSCWRRRRNLLREERLPKQQTSSCCQIGIERRLVFFIRPNQHAIPSPGYTS